jgi:hypothetical protein
MKNMFQRLKITFLSIKTAFLYLDIGKASRSLFKVSTFGLDHEKCTRSLYQYLDTKIAVFLLRKVIFTLWKMFFTLKISS